jgi:SWI/SNF-related matrix-associated actin-dependent regulator of chromatin subfamily A member 5
MSKQQVDKGNDDLHDDDDDDDSDVELVGVDMEEDDDGNVDVDMTNNDAEANALSTTKDDDKDDAINDELATKEAIELEAARKERLELIKAEQQKIETSARTTDPQGRLEYLLHQSDVFAHFLAGSVATTSNNTKKKKGKKTTSGAVGVRLTEEEEDEQLLKSAQSQRHSVVRLDQQPSILAPICKMHPYQLEGLNWMIKLHDHGINAILADGKVHVQIKAHEKIVPMYSLVTHSLIYHFLFLLQKWV